MRDQQRDSSVQAGPVTQSSPIPAAGSNRPTRLGRNLAVIGRRLKRRREPPPSPASRRHWWVVAFGGLLAAAAVILAIVYLDQNAPEWARDLPRAARSFFRAITDFGKSEWFLVPSGLLVIAIALADWGRVPKIVAAAWAEIGALGAYFFVAVAGAGLTSDLIKSIVGRSRPERIATDGTLAFQPLSLDSSFLSFPSGHATTIAAAFVAAVLMMQRRLNWPTAVLFVAGAAVCVSRVAVRAHFPSDVAAGIFVGAAFAFVLANWLGHTGVAFRKRPDGSLAAQTTVVRRLLRKPGGWRRLGRALVSALSVGERRPLA